MRYVGFDVEVVNASDQPLSFAGNAVYLRDDEGFSYRGGTVAGSEPPLQGRTMLGGEQARGWVWFEVPEGATLTRDRPRAYRPGAAGRAGSVTSIPGMPGATIASPADVTPSPAATATQAVAANSDSRSPLSRR